MNPANVAAHLSPLQLFAQADLIVKSIMVLLALASVASWGVIVDKLFRFRALQRRAPRAGLRYCRRSARLRNSRARSANSPTIRLHASTVRWSASGAKPGGKACSTA